MNKFLLLICLIVCVTSEVNISDFFPFGTANGDAELIRGSDVSSPPLNLSMAFPFFGLPQATLWINENGLISFNRKISDFTPWCKAAQSDYRIIAPFWADVDARRSGDIYYRQTTDAAVLAKGEAELAKAFSDIGHIDLKWAFIATWVNVTYFRDPPGSDESTRLRNTFQAILLTDGSQSFTIFYYNKITWTTGDVSNGINGLGGTPAEVGYDLGDRNHFEFVNGSCSNNVINITKNSNVKNPGKWMFKTFAVPTTPPPQCQTKYTGDFCVTPSNIDTLGHVNLDISEIQLTVTETVICRYHDPYANVTDYNATLLSLTHIQCFTPYFYTVGRITMELIILDKDGKERVLTGYLYIRALTEADNSLKFEPQANGSLLFKWNPSDLNYEDDSKSIKGFFHIVFMKTCEVVVDAAEACIKHPVMCELCIALPEACVEVYVEKVVVHAVASAVIEKGEEMIPALLPGEGGTLSRICGGEITPEKMACSGAWSLGQFAADSLETNHRPLYNAGKNLAAWVGDNCPNAKKLCEQWIDAFEDHGSEKVVATPTTSSPHYHLPIPRDVPPCPPTLDMAEIDPNFVVDPNCHDSSGCFYHPGAEICYFSAVPSPSGGGQQCCYQNRQIYLQRPGAGYPSILHPSIQAGFPHKGFEEIPLTLCCMVADKEDCDKYMGTRNPDDGSNYTAPTTSLGNGDPHYTTFDGLYYTFNGAGEFWLVKGSDKQTFSAQARHVVPSHKADYAYLM
uniref:Uncharacterized protein n=1 Tax=Panagrolaimus sp. PS1159 TaxID=55785 RepID=A0AC35F270_9BILA